MPRARRANNQPQVPFAYKLVLNQWLLSLFNMKRFEDLAESLRNEALEGLDEHNVHHFHHALTAQLFNLTQLPTELLLERPLFGRSRSTSRYGSSLAAASRQPCGMPPILSRSSSSCRAMWLTAPAAFNESSES